MKDSEWCWIMDDDAMPYPDALENLISSAGKLGDNASFIKSNQYDLGCDVPLTNFSVDNREDENSCRTWTSLLTEGFLKIRATTFVSLLLKSDAIEKCGLPCRDYFIWGDDTEYSLRLTAAKALFRPSGIKRFWIVISGMISGLFMWRKFNRFIQSQVKR